MLELSELGFLHMLVPMIRTIDDPAEQQRVWEWAHGIVNARPDLAAFQGRTVILGIRPEDVHLAKEGDAGSARFEVAVSERWCAVPSKP